MKTFVGLRFDDESTDILYRWFKDCQRDSVKYCGYSIDHVVAKPKISIELVHNNSEKPHQTDDFKPLGQIDREVSLVNPRIKHFSGHWNAVGLMFNCDWIEQRREELIQLGFKRRHKKWHPHVTIAFFSHFSSDQWVKLLPTRKLRVIEEFKIPFVQHYPHKAHYCV